MQGLPLDGVLLALERFALLQEGADELRKKVVPSGCVGPQHGGREASVMFSKTVLAIQKKRKAAEDAW
jgi:hypothetical protein